MTDHPADHGSFEELAAGYALDALEPADEQRYLRHARECPACAQALAGFREVAAALADTAPAAEPPPQLAGRIVAAALADLDVGHRPGVPPADAARPASPPQPIDPVAVPRATRRPAPGDWAAAGAGDAPATPGDAPAAPGSAGSAGPGSPVVGPGDAAATRGDAPPSGVVPLRPRARRWLRPVSAAAAAALIAGGGIWAGLAGTAANPLQLPVASCAHVAGCTEIPLTAADSHHVAAQLIVYKKTVWMLPDAMRANDTADQTYVLWQITGSHRPLAVGSFDVRPGAHAPIKIGGLAAPYHGTMAFAVSLEHGRTIPPAPSRVLALGQVA